MTTFGLPKKKETQNTLVLILADNLALNLFEVAKMKVVHKKDLNTGLVRFSTSRNKSGLVHNHLNTRHRGLFYGLFVYFQSVFQVMV